MERTKKGVISYQNVGSLKIMVQIVEFLIIQCYRILSRELSQLFSNIYAPSLTKIPSKLKLFLELDIKHTAIGLSGVSKPHWTWTIGHLSNFFCFSFDQLELLHNCCKERNKNTKSQTSFSTNLNYKQMNLSLGKGEVTMLKMHSIQKASKMFQKTL